MTLIKPTPNERPRDVECLDILFRGDLVLILAAKIYRVVGEVDLEKVRSDKRYFYEEHTCPTNFVRTAQVRELNDLRDDDPHGLFTYYDTVLFNHGRESYDDTVECSDELNQAVLPILERLQAEHGQKTVYTKTPQGLGGLLAHWAVLRKQNATTVDVGRHNHTMVPLLRAWVAEHHPGVEYGSVILEYENDRFLLTWSPDEEAEKPLHPSWRHLNSTPVFNLRS